MKLNKNSMKLPFLVVLTLCVCQSAFAYFTDPAKSPANSTTTNIYFGLDHDELETSRQVAKLIEELKTKFGEQELNIKITGRTCDLGEAAYNKALAEKRAYAVMEMMLMKGLKINYIEVESVGEDKPLVPNVSEANRKRNRSVSVFVHAGGLEQFLAAL